MGLNPKFLSEIYVPNSLSYPSSCFGYTRVSEEIYFFIYLSPTDFRGHVKRMPEERIPKLIMDWIPWERRKRGRSRKTRMERVQAAMTTRNLEPDQWRSREEWRLVSGRRRQLLINRRDRFIYLIIHVPSFLTLCKKELFTALAAIYFTLSLKRKTWRFNSTNMEPEPISWLHLFSWEKNQKIQYN